MNDFIAVAYQLFIRERDGVEERLQEQRTEEQPFVFITELGTVLPPFEKHVATLQQGDKIDFYIQPEEFYGEYHEELVVQLPLNTCLNDEGKLDERIFFVGNIIPLSNAQGDTFNGTIVSVDDEMIAVDLNHPKAGITMHFIGKVLEHRKATEEEMSEAVNASKQGCGCCGGGCDSCASGCGGCGQC